MTGKNWTNDWRTFITEVGALFRRGMDDAEVTKVFAGQRVIWTGSLAEKRFDLTLGGVVASCVAMTMPSVTVNLPNGRYATVDYLALSLRQRDRHLWHPVEVGSTVRFATRILKSSGPFSGVRSVSLDAHKGVIMFLTDNSVPVIRNSNEG